MKRTWTLLTFIFFQITTHAQWSLVQLNSHARNNSISFSGSTDVWLASDTGIYKSINNGGSFTRYALVNTLNQQYIGSWLNVIGTISNTTAVGVGMFYIGNDDIILRTVNGGQNWSEAYHATGTLLAEYNACTFPTALKGYIAGSDGKVMKSIDGGNTWNLVYQNASFHWKDMYFFSDVEGIIIGDNGILRTTNGSSFSTVSGGTAYEVAVSFSGNTGYLACNNTNVKLKKSTNRGAAWSVVTVPFGQAHGVIALSTDTVIVITQSEAYKSCNGGTTWEEFILPASPNGNFIFNDINFRNSNEIYISGEDGVLLRTTNGGGATKPIAMFSCSTYVCEDNNLAMTNNTSGNYTYQCAAAARPASRAG